MNHWQLIKQTAARFREAGIPDPDVDAALLLSHVTGLPPLTLRLDKEHQPTQEQLEAFDTLCRARMGRTPLQYLLGDAPFLGRSFQVDSRVLIPRPETELLCERAVHALQASGQAHPRALDLCCGSGCMAVSLALEVPGCLVDAADLSSDALCVARENAKRLGASIVLLQGDLWEAVGSRRYNVIVSNPPYIPDAACDTLQPEVLREPRMALAGGMDGLSFYRRIAQGAMSHLMPGGVLLLEVGLNQAEPVRQLMQNAGLAPVQIYPDWAGIPRMVEACNPNENNGGKRNV